MSRFHKGHLKRKFTGKMPRTRVSTLIKHRPLLLPLTLDRLHGEFAQRSLYTQKTLQTNALNTHTQPLLHRTALHTEAFTKSNFYTQKLLHREAFIQSSFDTNTDDFTRRSFYTQKVLHREACTQTSFYTRKYLHIDAFTHPHAFTQRRF